MDRQEIEQVVAQVKQALAEGGAPPEPTPGGKEPENAPPPVRLVTEAIVREAAKSGSTVIEIAPGALVTPLARDALRAYAISLASRLPSEAGARAGRAVSPNAGDAPSGPRMPSRARVAVGAVPTARALEQVVMASLREAGFIGLRVPCPVRTAAQLARQVAGAVSGGEALFGLIVEETGLVGPAVGNRVPGVIAATCHDALSARWARQRLGANVLCVSADLVAPTLLREILSVWIATPATVPPDVAAAVKIP